MKFRAPHPTEVEAFVVAVHFAPMCMPSRKPESRPDARVQSRLLQGQASREMLETSIGYQRHSAHKLPKAPFRMSRTGRKVAAGAAPKVLAVSSRKG